jgi:hypothetical protein
MRHYLVVANQTLGGDELVQLISRRAKSEPSEFFLVVPATPTIEMVQGVPALPVIGGIPLLPSTPEQSQALAEQRLNDALAQLKAVNVTVDGLVGHPDPVRAVETAMRGRHFDEIIVSTLPQRMSRWLRQDLPHRLEHKTGLPVTHVGVTKQASR